MLTSNPSAYSVKLFSPLGFSDHPLISVSCPIAPVLPLDPPMRRCFWYYASARWEDLRMYYSDFLWNEYCFQNGDPSECAQRSAKVIVSGMRTYIPHTFSTPHAKKPWFNYACSHAIKDREVAYKSYISLPTPENHTLYISAWNHAKSILRLAKPLSSIENVKTLPTLIPLKISGIYPKLSPTT